MKGRLRLPPRPSLLVRPGFYVETGKTKEPDQFLTMRKPMLAPR